VLVFIVSTTRLVIFGISNLSVFASPIGDFVSGKHGGSTGKQLAVMNGYIYPLQ